MKEHLKEHFNKFAKWTSEVAGSPWVFGAALGIIALWAITGPIFNFSDTWQLIINTGTTIITFLMVFLIQNTQNRDAKAIHLKLDELIRTSKGARNGLLDLEDLSDEELKELQQQFVSLRKMDGSALHHAVDRLEKELQGRSSSQEKH